MKPLMLIPPAQAEALYDAQEEAQTEDRFAPLPWLDDDSPEETSRPKSLTQKDDQARYPYHRMQAA